MEGRECVWEDGEDERFMVSFELAVVLVGVVGVGFLLTCWF